jgi:hypothetical protein
MDANSSSSGQAHGCQVIVTSSSDEKLKRAQGLAGDAWLGGTPSPPCPDTFLP